MLIVTSRGLFFTGMTFIITSIVLDSDAQHIRTGVAANERGIAPMTRIYGEPSAFASEALVGFCDLYSEFVRPVEGGVVRSTGRTNSEYRSQKPASASLANADGSP